MIDDSLDSTESFEQGLNIRECRNCNQPSNDSREIFAYGMFFCSINCVDDWERNHD